MLTINLQPFPILSTNRLLLNEVTLEDTQDFLQLNSDPDIMRYLDRESLTSEEEAKFIINRIKEDQEHNRGIMWKIGLKGKGDHMIGVIGFWRIMPENHRAEVGFMLSTSYWNQGIITEALKSVTNYGFQSLKLHSIEANVNPENSAARKMLEKSGFVQEAYFKENYYFNGRFIDTITFTLHDLHNH